MSIVKRIRIAVLGLAIGIAGTGTAAFVGYASARAQLSIAPAQHDSRVVVAPPHVLAAVQPTPPFVIDDPLANPAGTIDDLAAAKRHGWPALVLAALIAVALGLRTAGKRWPDVGWLSWLNTGKRAFWLAGGVSVASAVFDVIVMNGTAYAMGWAGFAALLALISAEGKH